MPNWNAVLEEIRRKSEEGHPYPHDVVRQGYLAELHALTGRTVIAYYSGFLSKPRTGGIEINDDDKNGFMMCIHETDREAGLDLILHTLGGDLAATESLVHYLREMYGRDIRAIVPQIWQSTPISAPLIPNSVAFLPSELLQRLNAPTRRSVKIRDMRTYGTPFCPV